MTRKALVAVIFFGLAILAAELAFAHHCGSFDDCYKSLRAAIAAAMGLAGLTLLSMGVDLIPGIGTAKGLVEAATGKDFFTGEELRWWERALGIVPFSAAVLGTGTLTYKAIGKATRSAEELSDAAKTTREVRALVPYYPINAGFAGVPTTTTLVPGSIVDRFGGAGGSFLSPAGTPFWARSLPFGAESRPLNGYEVLKPIDVKTGTVAPWFNQPGGGIQYDLGTRTVQDLIDGGYLKHLPKL